MWPMSIYISVASGWNATHFLEFLIINIAFYKCFMTNKQCEVIKVLIMRYYN